MFKFLLATLLLVSPALAQDQPPAVGSQATDQLQQLSQAISEEQRILVIGDQMAGGLGAGISRMGENDQNIVVTNRFNEISGLVRPEIYDWALAIPKMVEGKDFTTAFVFMGLNDRRDMRQGDQILKFISPEWITAYKQRVDGVIDALSAQKIKVYWMGEPPMGDPALDGDMQLITSYQKERVEAKGGVFIDLRTPFLGPDGKYSERGLDDTGADRRLRESDGVTFFKMGNNRLGQIALAALKNGVAVPAAAAPAPAAPAPSAPVATVDVHETPIFGQQDDNGASIAQGSTALVAAVAVDSAVLQANQSSSIGIGAAPGSSAETLFTTGLAAPAPTGRFDDFAVSGN
jgi:uncharacterized protein